MDKKRYLLVAFLGLVITTVAVGASTLAFGGRGNFDSNTNARGQAANVREQRTAPAGQQAIINNDYSAWQQAMTTQVVELRQRASDLETKINQDTFNKIVQAHELLQAGKQDEAKVIFDELGVFGPFGGSMGHMGRGMGLRANATSTNPQ